MSQVVEMRCPVESQRMFGKLLVAGAYTITDNLMEFSCDRCRKAQGVVRVLHRFNLAGELVQTEVVW